MTYCTDQDLLKYRSNILQLGITDWAEQRQESYTEINRLINVRWYRKAAVQFGLDPVLTEFNPALVANDSLKRLECYKTLEFAYMLLMKDSPEADGFERNMDLFSKKYGEELNTIVTTVGVDYDWNADDEVTIDETVILAPRRLYKS